VNNIVSKLSTLRADAEALSAGIPALLANADRLAATLSLGSHGRRRAGQGEEFWQYRPAGYGDNPSDIDWRRSGRTDAHFVRQLEFQTAQTITFWVDGSQSMQFENKAARARLLAMACANLLLKGGERVGLMNSVEPAKSGISHLDALAFGLMHKDTSEYGTAPQRPLQKGSRAVFLSDFLGDWDNVIAGLSHAASQDVQGCLIQILDPTEMSFPFKGRTLFESMKGAVSFESMRAQSLRTAYLDRLAKRQDDLADLAARTGWRFEIHNTDSPAQNALLWLYSAIGKGAI
jgi:MoxR-like ATPase